MFSSMEKAFSPTEKATILKEHFSRHGRQCYKTQLEKCTILRNNVTRLRSIYTSLQYIIFQLQEIGMIRFRILSIFPENHTLAKSEFKRHMKHIDRYLLI